MFEDALKSDTQCGQAAQGCDKAYDDSRTSHALNLYRQGLHRRLRDLKQQTDEATQALKDLEDPLVQKVIRVLNNT